jgi:hypothetical protein
VWKELRSKETIILKRWEKTWLTRAWSGDFQLATTKANTIIYLFPTTFDIEKGMEIDEACTNPTMTTLIVMEGCLNEKYPFATSLETLLLLQVHELKD